MRIVAIACIKNEIDIIEPFVRHTLAHVDEMLVIDHGSTDGTRDLLAALQQSGLPIRIRDESDPAWRQAEWLTELMHDAVSRYGADWVCPLDADEFLAVPPDATLSELLSWTSDKAPLRLRWRTYVPADDDDSAQRNAALRLTHHLVEEARDWSKVMVPRAWARQHGTAVTSGSHEVRRGDEVHAGHEIDGLRLAHFPLRSPGQYALKTAMGYLKTIASPDLPEGDGFHYTKPFELLKRDLAGLARRWQQDALLFAMPEGSDFKPRLVRDPLHYAGGPMDLTPEFDDWNRAFQAIINLAEVFARKVGERPKRWWDRFTGRRTA